MYDNNSNQITYNKLGEDYMVIRILFLLLSLLVLVNLCIITTCYITGTNIYQKYGRQLLIASGIFVLLVAALYIALALIGLS